MVQAIVVVLCTFQCPDIDPLHQMIHVLFVHKPIYGMVNVIRCV